MHTEQVKCSTWNFLPVGTDGLVLRCLKAYVRKRTASCYVTPSKCLTTFGTDQVESSKIITFAQRVLFAVGPINREEFGSNDSTTILIDL